MVKCPRCKREIFYVKIEGVSLQKGTIYADENGQPYIGEWTDTEIIEELRSICPECNEPINDVISPDGTPKAPESSVVLVAQMYGFDCPGCGRSNSVATTEEWVRCRSCKTEWPVVNAVHNLEV